MIHAQTKYYCMPIEENTPLEQQRKEEKIRKIVISEALKNVLLKINNDYFSETLLRGSVHESELSKPEKNINYLDLSHSNKGSYAQFNEGTKKYLDYIKE